MPRGGKFVILSRQPEQMDLGITQSGKSNGTTGERHRHRSPFHIPQQVQNHRTVTRKAPDSTGSLTLTYSSPSSNSVSLCTTTLVTDMSGCCSLASLMAWASACQGQERALSVEEKAPFSGWPNTCYWAPGTPPLLFEEAGRLEMGSLFLLEAASHFPRVPICPGYFQIIIHVEEAGWLWIPAVPSPQDLGKQICSDLSILTYHPRLNAQAAESMLRSVVRIEGMVYSIQHRAYPAHSSDTCYCPTAWNPKV